jgi:hypothetical protein
MPIMGGLLNVRGAEHLVSMGRDKKVEYGGYVFFIVGALILIPFIIVVCLWFLLSPSRCIIDSNSPGHHPFQA